MTRALNIAIIGAGVGGLAAALALRARGMEVGVYERSAEVKEIGAGLRLTPNALKALRTLGCEDAAMAIGVRMDSAATLNWRSGRLVSVQDLSATRYGAAALTIHRADMLEIFHQRLPRDIIHLDAACTGVSAEGATAVARFANGSEIEADIVIGADGIRSVVRESLFGPDKPRFTGCICWRGLVPIERHPHPAHGSQRWLGPHGHIVSYPVRRGELLNFVAHYESNAWTGESWTQEADRAELAAAYGLWNEEVQRMLAASERHYKWALYDRAPLAQWGKGGVTLLGDAAHPMLPYLSQGASMSFEDGCVLAQALHADPGNPAQALRRYEAARRPRTARAQLGSREQATSNHLASPFAQLRRDIVTALRTRFSAERSPESVSWIYDFDIERGLETQPGNPLS